MNKIQSVLITGANAGLGFECARQMALKKGVQKVHLACRNESKALEAKEKLENLTGRKVFEILIVDVMDLNSVRSAVRSMKEPVDAVVLNAGGIGGKTPNALTAEGVTHIFAVNLLGHTVLVDEMIKRGMLNSVVVYSGSEGARGISKMGIAKPTLESATVEEFVSIADGSKFSSSTDLLAIYAEIKLTAALWMASVARRNPNIRFVTMSPGGTTGTNGMNDLPFLKKMFFKYVGGLLMPAFGMMHGVETGAKRYVDAVMNQEFLSGKFYASKSEVPTGPVTDQATHYDIFDDTKVQDNAYEAMNQFVSSN